jgi:hypothetical protein
LSKFRAIYEQQNPIICEVVEEMTLLNYESRPSPSLLLEQLPPYDQVVQHFTTSFSQFSNNSNNNNNNIVLHELQPS